MHPRPGIRNSQIFFAPETNSVGIEADPPNSTSQYLINRLNKWLKKRENNQKYKYTPADHARHLYKSIEECLDNAAKQEQLATLISDLRVLLTDKERELKIDDCTRWLVLHNALECCRLNPEDAGKSAIQTSAAEEIITAEKNISIIIIRIIVEMSPYLSFRGLSQSHKPSEIPEAWEECLKLEQCLFEHLHLPGEMPDLKGTPIHTAAEKGNGKAVKHMIYNAGLQKSRGLPEVLKLGNLGSKSKKTALSLAAVSETGELGALHALLSFNTSLADTPDITFKKALKNGQEHVVEAFLEYQELRKMFVDTEHILFAIGTLEGPNIHKEMRQKRVAIINNLIRHMDPGNKISKKIVGKIIQHDLMEVWDENKLIFGSNTSGLLHLAVQHQNTKFVELFLRKYDSSVTSTSHNYYPLWYNNNVIENGKHSPRNLGGEKSKKTHEDIRKLLVTATIKSRNVDKMQDLLEIFQHSDENVNELCFDLSRFNSKLNRVSYFIHSLIQHQDDAKLFTYEETIRYAEFPALDLNMNEKETFGDQTQVDHNEIFDALDWLRHKTVKDIIELTVPDRLVNPHDEVRIGKYVEKFKVEVLHWRFLDMSISVFKDSDSKEHGTLQRIRELHLYSSGKRATIQHWLSEDGIRLFTNLTTLEIYVVQELMTKEKCRPTVKFIETEFKRLSNEINNKRTAMGHEKLAVGVSVRPWNPTREGVADLEEIADRAVPKLSRFIKSYHTYVQDRMTEDSKPFQPIRVAVIDNGVLSISPSHETHSAFPNGLHTFNNLSAVDNVESSSSQNMSQDEYQIDKNGRHNTLSSRMKKGQSFVEENFRVSPWFFASDPHGTQMANLICAIDPCCDLYVAKVNEGRSGITPVRVERTRYPLILDGTMAVQAIRWAINQKVDIISMSFAILEGTEGLKEACEDAAKAGIVMLCSTHDEGLNINKAFPSFFHETITITSCDEFGALAKNTRQKYNYAIRGMDVAAGKVPFLESEDYISGSSVATAIAAGLGSLILSCDRLAQGCKNYGKAERRTILEHYFKKMAFENQKYILLEKFAEIDKKIKDGREVDARAIIEGLFRDEIYEPPYGS